MIRNHPTLADLTDMGIGAIAALPASDLAKLAEEAREALDRAKTIKDWLDGAIALKYGDAAAAARQTAGKDAGTIRFQDGPVTVIADLPKKVEWDQPMLAALAERIRVEGENPAEYVDISFKVSERKYGAWPSHIRSAFEAARTVRVGKPTFQLSRNNEVTR
jgi:hypothetical protein